MALSFLSDIKDKHERWAQNLIHQLEDETFRPDHLLIKPVDAWPGNFEKGQDVAHHPKVMDPQSWPEFWHHFSFLRDLRMLGTEGRLLGQAMIHAWLEVYAFHKAQKSKSVRVFIDGETGQRLYHWCAHYEFFLQDCDEELHDMFFDSLIEQSRFLCAHACKKINPETQGYGYIQGLKGAVISTLALNPEVHDLDVMLERLQAALQVQILDDGTHISRAPYKLLYVLKSVLEVRTSLTMAAKPIPDFFDPMIQKMVSALRTLRHPDGGFVTLQGAQEGQSEAIDCISAQSGLKSKALKSLPKAGFEKITQGRTSLYIDHGLIPPKPYDRSMHLSPLAFEMSHGKERMIVSCGSSKSDLDWASALKASPAHSMLILADEDAYTYGENIRTPQFKREDIDKAVLIEGSHEGYVGRYNVTHTRRFFVSNQGQDIRGEDYLNTPTPLVESKNIAIRFHLHPRVIVSKTQDGTGAFLRLPSGIGWRFHCDGGALELEDSIYLGESDTPRKTQQLVIYAAMSGTTGLIKWAFQAEGLSGSHSQKENNDGETANLL